MIVPQVSFGETLYSQEGIDKDYCMNTGSPCTTSGHFYNPADVSPPTSNTTTFYTTTGNETNLYLYRVSGNSCANIETYGLTLTTTGGASWGGNMQNATADGNLCRYDIQTPTASVNLGAIQISAQFIGVGVVLAGSLLNDGHSKDQNAVELGTGGIAFWITDGGGITIPTDGITSTTNPASMTYVNNPVPFSGTYNNGLQGAYDQIVFDLNNTTQSFQSSIVKPTIPISQVGLEYDFSQNLPLEGNYTYNVRLWDSVNATGTPWFAGNNFSLGTTTATTTPIFNAPELECNTFDLACYIKKAFIWLLYPTESLVESYNGFLTTIQAKPPIGYFTLLADNLNGLNASSTPLVNVTIPAHLKTYFFSPFDTGIASILWFFFAINFYRRLKHITI